MEAFDCKQCGACCYGEGGISLENAEVDAISQFLHMPSQLFMTRFCEKRNGEISLRTGQDGYCIFFDHREKCLIHPVKPRPCVLWPFYPALLKDEDNWNSAKEACPGINPDCSFEEFVKQGEEDWSTGVVA